MLSDAVQFASVVLVAVLFGVAAAPYGLAIGLPPVAVVLGVFAGCAGFACLTVPIVLNLVPEAAGRRARWAMAMAPRLARVWQRAGARAAGARTAVAIDRTSAVLDRLGVPGVALLAPVFGRWMVPAAGVALGGSRRHLLCWAVIGCAVWALVLTVAFDLLIAAL